MLLLTNIEVLKSLSVDPTNVFPVCGPDWFYWCLSICECDPDKLFTGSWSKETDRRAWKRLLKKVKHFVRWFPFMLQVGVWPSPCQHLHWLREVGECEFMQGGNHSRLERTNTSHSGPKCNERKESWKIKSDNTTKLEPWGYKDREQLSACNLVLKHKWNQSFF